jgi:taurine dioxygenase
MRWKKGTVAVWDKRCTRLYVVKDYCPEHRCMRRMTIEGDASFYWLSLSS